MKLPNQILKKISVLIVLSAAVCLPACTSTSPGPGTQVNTQPENAPSPSPETTAIAPTTQAIEGINFQTPKPGQNTGFVDAVNNKRSQSSISVAPGTPIQIAGWAILPDATKPADMVIVTAGEEKAIASTTPVNGDRPDVGKALKNKALDRSGWVAKIDPATLSGGEVSLQVWAYNSQTKEAYPIGAPVKVVLK
jgi:hypothetical protein